MINWLCSDIMEISILKIYPSLPCHGLKNKFVSGENNIKSIVIKDEIIKITSENDEKYIKTIEIPTKDLIKIKYENSEWDTQLISMDPSNKLKIIYTLKKDS